MRALAVALFLVPSAALAAKVPAFVTLPPGVTVNADSVVDEEFGEAAFALNADEEPVRKAGHHVSATLVFGGVPEGTEDNDLWAKLKPALVKGGWTVVKEFDANPYSATLRYQKAGKDAWASVTLFTPTDTRLELVELSQQPLKFAVAKPAPQPEKVSAERGDFPWLPPLPGSKPLTSGAEGTPMAVPLEGHEEAQVVAPGSIKKSYARAGTSNVQFVTAYKDALTAAGWKVLTVSQGLGQSDAVLVAHYGQGGRDLWAYLHNAGEEYTLQAADAGQDNLAATLAKECHVPLYGVLFDFDKATLKPESDAVLGRARDALKAQPKLAIEVQGHTDNVGGDDYNAKLSDARAHAVMSWLVKNGIPAAQLSAKGYGRGKPVASNDTPEGRAKNRRVELACRK